MKEDILKIFSEKEMRVDELKRKVKGEELNLILEELKDSGLIFVNKKQNYSITLLGKILALGLKDVYESIVEKKDLFDFFKTRVPSAIPDDLLVKFKFCEDFQILGRPDFTDRHKEILNKAISMQPYAEKDVCISSPIMFKPGTMHIVAALKKRPKTCAIISEKEYEKNKTFIKVSEKVSNLKTRIIDTENQYMGLLYVDGISSFFGFCDLDDKPGWDAIIYTEDKECIEWVKENFDYMWDNLAKKP